MLKVVVVMALLSFSFSAMTSSAEQGCYIGTRIYFDKTGEVSFLGLDPRDLYDPNLYYEDYTGICNGLVVLANRTNLATQGLLNTPITCGFTGDSFSAATRGYVWNFDVLTCPLDEYIKFLFLISAGLVWYNLRDQRKQIA